MKKINMFLQLSLLAGAAFLSSCVSEPGSYQTVINIDDIDLSEEIATKIEKSKNEDKIKIAVVPEQSEYSNKWITEYGINKAVGDQIEALCSELSMFEVVSRSELDIIGTEEALKNLDSASSSVTLPKSVDALLVYAISACNMDAKNFTESEYVNGKSVSKSVKKHSGYISLKLTLIDTVDHSKLFTKTVSGKSDWDEGENAQLLVDATDIALKDFIKQFAFDFAPTGYVTQTTGGGRWAMISLGTSSGLKYHSRVEFFKDQNGQKRPFAYGEVREPNYDYSWVLVDDYSNANVRVNAKVKVSASQARSFWRKCADAFGMIYGQE